MNKVTVTITSNEGVKEYKISAKEMKDWMELLELTQTAQDSFIDQMNEWKQLTNKEVIMAEVRKIRWLSGGGFVDKEVMATTVAQLRTELEISSTADIAVDGVNVSATHELSDGSVVAAVQNNKSGGDSC